MRGAIEWKRCCTVLVVLRFALMAATESREVIERAWVLYWFSRQADLREDAWVSSSALMTGGKARRRICEVAMMTNEEAMLASDESPRRYAGGGGLIRELPHREMT